MMSVGQGVKSGFRNSTIARFGWNTLAFDQVKLKTSFDHVEGRRENFMLCVCRFVRFFVCLLTFFAKESKTETI